MKTVIVYSGGLDSTVLLYHMRAAGHELHALSIDYGQRHRCELERAAAICAQLNIPQPTANLSAIQPLLAGNSLTSPEIEVAEGHYTEETMKTTVVPNRNMIFLAVATGHALSIKAGQIAYAAHSGDHAIYPDCRNEFADAMATAIALADWEQVQLSRPFVNWTKADIVKRGAELAVPFAKTWSCYKGGKLHCGRCGTCIERREAFHLANVEDPTPYALRRRCTHRGKPEK
ncbi:7-cyano-7-deazaguanine synthase QueC [Coraliomargarita sp. SDUM461004]|uniref:7-cyano-7-deazaguanine synthase n=1 Tax=Thalassobacterium sedimentorum TaxID=3041258 RepID=A0ABU1AKK2_9BACT|nr:7-cyano-7-deazaguanine synthase QueC [Coraliomargarita sp. SDUM461004]MDQ8194365.1 7-cyano-7-deazaguanine synthase QueC [Coraliomargarita sp. SDUM461004]